MTLSKEAKLQFPIGELDKTACLELVIRLRKYAEIEKIVLEGDCLIITPSFVLMQQKHGVTQEVNAHSTIEEIVSTTLEIVLDINVDHFPKYGEALDVALLQA